MKTIELWEKCKACKGTGLYRGMAEADGAAIVCRSCGGTGRYHFVHEYEEFEGKIKATGIKQVFKTNPGIMLGVTDDVTLEDFGGMSYNDWIAGKPFPPKSENRKYTCPAWWYQTEDYKKKPKWKGCGIAGIAFSSCKFFGSKDECWARWDTEFGESEIVNPIKDRVENIEKEDK